MHHADVHEVVCSKQLRREEYEQPIVLLFPLQQEMCVPVEDVCVCAG